MNMMMRVGRHSANLGPFGTVNSLFDTIACRLEPQGRATRFPVVSDDLKRGRLEQHRAAEALRELDTINRELCALPGTKILWAGEAPIGDGMASAMDRLSAPDGRPLLAHLRYGAEQCAKTGQVLSLGCPERTQRDLWTMVCVLLAGLVWALFGYALLPHLLISSIGATGEHPSGIRVWAFGLLVVCFAVLWLLGQALPAVRIWFVRRNWAITALSAVVIGLWMVFSIVR